jgi:cell pole-organizing protein PopZ
MAARVLVLANRTAATPPLMAAVRERAATGDCAFTLLVPRPYWDPDTEEAALTLELAVPLLEEAAGAQVTGLIGDSDPFVAVSSLLERESFDEVIVSTLPEHVSKWLRHDLPHRIRQLGVPVTVVTAPRSARPHPV